jgi:transposase
MGADLDVPITGFVGRLEVIEGPSGRRQRTDAEKARIVAESLMPDVRVADVARKYGATRWQIYDWRKRLRREQRRLALPEGMASAPAFAAVVVDEAPQRKAASCIEIVVGDIVIRAEPGVDDAHLSRIIRIARRRNDRAGCASEGVYRHAADRLSQRP